MKQTKLNIVTKTEKYPIIIGSNLTSSVSKIFKLNSIDFDKCLIVVDKNVPKKFVSNIKRSFKNKSIFILFFNASEKNKNINSVNRILEVLLNKNFSRNDVLISIGGGITGDVSGFAASLFKRGLKFANIPTTLLAQVDSSIGGKTGVNSKYGKNLIGNFYQPSLVLSDIQFLKSLSKREIICGYGEILKHSLIDNKKFFNFLNKNFKKILSLSSPFIEKAIYESCKIKKKIVVEKINLKIGEFTCVEPISLINTFNAAVLGSWLDSSEITIETIPFEGKCSKCKRLYFPKKENGYKSPCCNFNLEEIISGRELKIASIDFKEK